MGRKIYDEDLRLNLILNGQELNKGSKLMVTELGKMEMQMINLEQTAKKLAAEIKVLEKDEIGNATALKAARKAYSDTTQEIRAQAISIEKLRQQVGLAGMTVQQLKNHAKALQVQLNNMTGNPALRQRLLNDLAATNSRITTLTTGAGRLAQAWERIERTATKVGSILGMFTMVVYSVVRVVTNVITRMKELEDLIGTVRKNTNLLAGEVWNMKNAFDQWDTRTSTDDLLRLAVVAGKLGIEGKDNIMNFVNSANMIQIALGDDLNGNVEDTVNSIGKLTNAFRVLDKIDPKTGKLFTLDAAMLRTGDVLNQLAKSSAASAGTILNYMTRLSSVSELAGFTQAQIGGLASAMDAMNIPSERGATALQKIMLQLANPKKINDFAEAIGIVGNKTESMSVQYERLLRENPNDVLMTLMQKFVSTKDGLVELTGGLQQFGVRGQYMTAVLGSLAQNIDVVRAQQLIATQAWEDGTSVLMEYNIMNNNFTANVLKQQRIIKMQTDQMEKDAEPAVLRLVTAWASFVVGIKNTVDWIGRHWQAMKILTFAYIALKAPTMFRITNLILEDLWLRKAYAAEALKVFWMKASILWTRNLSAEQLRYIASSKLLMIVHTAMTRGFAAARAQMILLADTGAIVTFPYLAIAGAAAAVAGAFYWLVIRTKELTEADKIHQGLQKKINDDYFTEKGNLNTLIDRLKDVNISSKERNDVIKTIQEQYGQYLPFLTKEGITVEEVAGSYDKLVEAMGRKIIYNDAMEAAGKNEALLLKAQNKVNDIKDQIAKEKASGGFQLDMFDIGSSAESVDLLENNLRKAEKELMQFSDLKTKLTSEIDKAKPPKDIILTGVAGMKEAAAANIAERQKLNDEINAAQAAIDLKNKALKSTGYDSKPEEAALKIKIESAKKLLTAYEGIQADLAKAQSFTYKDESYDTFKDRQEQLKSELEAEQLMIHQHALDTNEKKEVEEKKLRQLHIEYLNKAIADREKSWRTEDGEEKAYMDLKSERIALLREAQLDGQKATKKEAEDELLDLENEYNKDEADIKHKYLKGEIKTEDEYNDQLLKRELIFLAAKRNLYEVGSKEYVDAENELLSKKIAVEKAIEDKLTAVRKQFARTKTDENVSEIEEDIALENDRWDEEKKGLEKQLVQKTDLSMKEIEINDTIHKTIEEKEKDHQLKISNIKKIAIQEELDKLKEQGDSLGVILNSGALFSKKQLAFYYNNKKNMIMSQYAFEKKAAGKNKKDLDLAEKNKNHALNNLDQERLEQKKNIQEGEMQLANSYIDSLIGLVGAQSDLGIALMLLQQGLAIANIWIKAADTNFTITAAAQAMFASVPGGQAMAVAYAAPAIAGVNTGAALSTGLIALQTVAKLKQKAEGSYPVIGADDGRVYDAVEGGKPQTGVYSVPTLLNMSDGRSLVGERAPELVVDGDTFRRIQLNAPDILRDIYAYAGKGPQRIKQMAEGSYSGETMSGRRSEGVSGRRSEGENENNDRMTTAINRLNANLEKGITAKINKFGHGGIAEGMNDINRFNKLTK